ncbi:sugar O-acetyltransferase [Rothia sp. ZJ1223]|uniref:sugar O-acetyltransferase n=1 Tax=Rothia sp. ZJ1223 TaxID=2811098 RepID=UPI00195EE7C7|nr:sugar O-acetyltransferase [Rothia sp. ZJ1223]MBM7052076.1 sugar O-acetyltransferase [Rothia sp. ZJ1223]
MNVDPQMPSPDFRDMVAGKPYRPDDYCSAITLRAENLVQQYTQYYRARDEQGMSTTLEELLGSVGEGTTFRPHMDFDYGINTFVGSHCFFNYGAVILDVAPVYIGDYFMAGPGVQILTPTHPLNPADRQAYWEAGLPITIGNNVWAGGGAIFCPGVTVGNNCVIGAGSVVTKDIPANSVAVGNPARLIKTVTESDRPDYPHPFSVHSLTLAETGANNDER